MLFKSLKTSFQVSKLNLIQILFLHHMTFSSLKIHFFAVSFPYYQFSFFAEYFQYHFNISQLQINLSVPIQQKKNGVEYFRYILC